MGVDVESDAKLILMGLNTLNRLAQSVDIVKILLYHNENRHILRLELLLLSRRDTYQGPCI